MAKEIKPVVDYNETFAELDIRVGRIVELQEELSTLKRTYRMVIDFGKFGKKVSYGRFTRHPEEEALNRLVLGVLNLGPKAMGALTSEVLVLGTQYPGGESGEATFVCPVAGSKIGSKLF